MLTRKQMDLLEFIHKRMQKDGVPPSFDEMKEALDLRSKSGIHRLITALEERGFIRRLPHRARALEVLKLPDDLRNKMAGETKAADADNLVEVNFTQENGRTANLNDARNFDGDVVVIRETSVANNGDIVVALVEDSEATLKKFMRQGQSIALEAANPAYETRIFRDDQVKVQGKLVGLIRTY